LDIVIGSGTDFAKETGGIILIKDDIRGVVPALDLGRKTVSKICGAGVVIGIVTVYAGLEVAYLGFGGLTTIIGISMIIYFIWVGILGVLMWKKSMSKSIQ
jgi:P-type Cu+ transporter